MPFLNKFGKVQDSICGLVFSLSDLKLSSPETPLIPLHEFAPVPLKNVDIHAKVVDFISEITVTQTYINVENVSIETTYMFPIEEEAAVTFFEAEVDGRKIVTEVKEKEAAREEYDNAVKYQKTAVLLEETQPDIFQIKLGQLKPGAGAKIVLKYISELPLDESKIRLTIPTTIVPRYVPSKDVTRSGLQIASMSYNTQTPAPATINVEGIMKTELKTVECPSHDFKVSKSEKVDSHGNYKFEGKISANTSAMDRDFILLIEGKDADEMNKPVVYLEKYPMEDESLGLVGMLSLVPSFILKDQPTELIFLVDRSGSMGWGNGPEAKPGIEQAKQALELFLHSLPTNCYFNIYSFGSTFDSIFGVRCTKYSDDSMRQAISHVRSMSANYGGTEIYSPLKSILDNPSWVLPHLRQIFVLTDGAVSNAPMVISLIKERNESGRIFSLGLGSSASRHLVKGIARAGKGTAMFARQDEDLRPKVMTQLKHALQPAMNDIEIIWDGVSFNEVPIKKEKGAPVELESRKTLLGYMKPKKAEETVQKNNNDRKINGRSVQIPSKAPPVFDGQRLLMYWDFGKFWEASRLSKGDSGYSLIYPESKTCFPMKVEIIAESPDGPLKVELGINESNIMEGGNFIKKLAARKKIQEMEENQELDEYGNVCNNIDANDRKQSILSLGIENSLASSQTSFVGVDKTTKKRINEGIMRKSNIDNQIPSGFAMTGPMYGYMSPPGATMHAASSAASAMHPASAQRSSLCGRNMSGDLNNHHAKLSKCPNNAMKAFSFSASSQLSPSFPNALQSGTYPQRVSHMSRNQSAISACPSAQVSYSLSSGIYPQQMSFAQPNAMAAFASGMVSQNCSIIQDAHSRRAELCSYEPVNISVPKGETTFGSVISLTTLDDCMVSLINFQSYDGSFTCPQDKWKQSIFESCFGKRDDVIASWPMKYEINEPIGYTNFNTWTTALAIKFMELKMSEKKDMWELVAKKGERFIKQQLEASKTSKIVDHEFQTLMDRAEKFIKKGRENEEHTIKGVHSGITCDGCTCDPIKGERYKCITCLDYDLCQPCKMKGVHTEHQHEPIGINVTNEVHIGVTCDECGVHPMVGFRHKCLMCPDFDICHSCRSTTAHSHKNMTIIGSTDTSNRLVHQGIVCDGCNSQPIVGFRFKCLNCPDYDLCATCKYNSIHSHHEMQRMV